MEKLIYLNPYVILYPISFCFVISHSLVSFRCLPDQSSALLQLRQEFATIKPYSSVNASRSKRKVMATWNGSTDCCLWSGVKCNMSTGHVVSLDLSSSGLQGRLRSNSSLFSLYQLQQLNMAFNDFYSSPIPSSFGQLSSGKIPSEYFRNWSNVNEEPVRDLHYRDAKDGYYQYLPSDYIDMTQDKVLSILKSIDLSDNHFQGEIPDSIAEIPSLVLLNLSNNCFTRSIPVSLGCLKELEAIDFSRNNLSGEIPEQLANLTFLSFLDLSHNQLTGQIPQGKLFSTFSNSSYEGNLGLCGLPLSKKCEEVEKPSFDYSDVTEYGDWRSILMGCGFGFVVGLITGHIIFSIRLQGFEEALAIHIIGSLFMKNECGQTTCIAGSCSTSSEGEPTGEAIFIRFPM